MGIEGETKKIWGPHEILEARMNAQKVIMEILLGADAFDDEKIRWIEENSESFGNFFDSRKSDEDFLVRCMENSNFIFEEYQTYKNESEQDDEQAIAA